MASQRVNVGPSSPSSSIKAEKDHRPLRIVQYSATASLASALLTVVYQATAGRNAALRERDVAAQAPITTANINGSRLGVERTYRYRHPTGSLAAAAAFNTAVVGMVFFGLREYGVSPILEAYRRQHDGEGLTTERKSPLTWAAMRLYHLPDTALTGAMVGGAINVFRRGPRGILPGSITVSLACTAIQLAINEARVQRVRFISRNMPSMLASASSGSHLLDTVTSPPSELHAHTLARDANALPHEHTSRPEITSLARVAPGPAEESEGRGLSERLLALIGIMKVSEEEYLRRLKAKREMHLERIRELESILERDKEESRKREKSS